MAEQFNVYRFRVCRSIICLAASGAADLSANDKTQSAASGLQTPLAAAIAAVAVLALVL